jgi:hypothetical protein
MRKNILFCLSVVCFVSQVSFAAEVRTLNQIRTPAVVPLSADSVDRIRPVALEVVEKAVNDLFAAWNEPHLEQYLHKELYDKSRLLDTIDSAVPRDATVRVLSIQGVETLQQYVQKKVRTSVLVSRVSAVVRTQIEFNDPTDGLQRREGTAEYVFEIIERVRP